MEPKLYTGNIFVDNRGELGYINDLDLSNVKRFYTIKNHVAGFIRAWHGHKKEEKYFMVLSGAALIGAIPILLWDGDPVLNYDGGGTVFSMTSSVPSVLHIPGGYANGFKLLTKDTKLMVWSTATLEESKADDYRFNSNQCSEIWEVVER